MDDADRAQADQESVEQALKKRRSDTPLVLDPGKPGDCDMCGEWSGRLISGVCAPCRDKYKL
jgi:hypothetical protein